MEEADERIWRNRFIIIQLSRIGATVMVIVGLLIWQTGLARPGGMPELGIPITLISLVASFAAPRLLVRKWRTPPTS